MIVGGGGGRGWRVCWSSCGWLYVRLFSRVVSVIRGVGGIFRVVKVVGVTRVFGVTGDGRCLRDVSASNVSVI